MSDDDFLRSVGIIPAHEVGADLPAPLFPLAPPEPATACLPGPARIPPRRAAPVRLDRSARQAIGLRVFTRRCARNLSVRKLGELLDVDPGWIIRVERGRASFSDTQLAALAFALDLDFSEFQEGP